MEGITHIPKRCLNYFLKLFSFDFIDYLMEKIQYAITWGIISLNIMKSPQSIPTEDLQMVPKM